MLAARCSLLTASAAESRSPRRLCTSAVSLWWWGLGGEALRRVRRGGGHPLSAFVTPDVYGLSGRRFGDGSAAAVAAFASCVAKGGRRKQGLVPDIGVHFG